MQGMNESTIALREDIHMQNIRDQRVLVSPYTTLRDIGGGAAAIRVAVVNAKREITVLPAERLPPTTIPASTMVMTLCHCGYGRA